MEMLNTITQIDPTTMITEAKVSIPDFMTGIAGPLSQPSPTEGRGINLIPYPFIFLIIASAIWEVPTAVGSSGLGFRS